MEPQSLEECKEPKRSFVKGLLRLIGKPPLPTVSSNGAVCLQAPPSRDSSSALAVLDTSASAPAGPGAWTDVPSSQLSSLQRQASRMSVDPDGAQQQSRAPSWTLPSFSAKNNKPAAAHSSAWVPPFAQGGAKGKDASRGGAGSFSSSGAVPASHSHKSLDPFPALLGFKGQKETGGGEGPASGLAKQEPGCKSSTTSVLVNCAGDTLAGAARSEQLLFLPSAPGLYPQPHAPAAASAQSCTRLQAFESGCDPRRASGVSDCHQNSLQQHYTMSSMVTGSKSFSVGKMTPSLDAPTPSGLSLSASLTKTTASACWTEPTASPTAAQSECRLSSRVLAVSKLLPASMRRPFWRLEDFLFLAQLNTNPTTDVYQVQCKRSGETLVLKVYHTLKLHSVECAQLMREVSLHAGVDHPSILKLYAAFQEGTKVVLVQEFAAGGDLYSFTEHQGGRLLEQLAVETVLLPLLRALHYLHSHGIVHRDIKLENMLFVDKQATKIKLGDFGIAINLKEERGVTRAGTLEYMSPEVLRCPGKAAPQDNKDRDDLAYTHSVDVWAVGVLTYELLNGCTPFTGASRAQTEMQIQVCEPAMVAEVSPLAEDFILACLNKVPHDRPTPLQLLAHPWIKAYTRGRVGSSGGSSAGGAALVNEPAANEDNLLML